MNPDENTKPEAPTGTAPTLRINVEVQRTIHPKIYRIGETLCHGKAEVRVALNAAAKAKVLELVDGLFSGDGE